MRHNHSVIDDPDALLPAMALVSDVDANVRSTYIGADNRAGGQFAGLILGRRLEREAAAFPSESKGSQGQGLLKKTSLLMDNSKIG
jgi:ABC-type sugar transport system substrate-binding protein